MEVEVEVEGEGEGEGRGGNFLTWFSTDGMYTSDR